MSKDRLVAEALSAMQSAYAPYSGYKVGAALLTQTGKIYVGCNIENSSYTATVCAERTAFFKAVSDGEDKFKMIAVCGGKNGIINGVFPPCGVCRQVMAEFCSPDFTVLLIKDSVGNYDEFTLSQLFPFAFEIKSSKEK